MPRKKKEIVPDDPFNYAGLISFLCVAALIYFSITKTGPVGLFINNLLSYLFGNLYLVLLISLFVCAFINVFLTKKVKFNIWFYIGIGILNVAVMLLSTVLFYGKVSEFPFTIVSTAFSYIKLLFTADVIFGGGLIGTLLMYFCMSTFDYAGTITILVLLFLIAAILLIPLGVYKVFINGAKDASINTIHGVKDRVNDMNERRQIKNELNRLELERRTKLANRQRIEEEQRRASLQRDIHNIFNENLSIPTMEKEEEKIEDVKNTSDFSKTYFLDDNIKVEQTSLDVGGSGLEADGLESGEIESKVEEPIKVEAKAEVASIPHGVDIEPVHNETKSKIYHLPPMSLLTNIASSKASNINKNSAEVKGQKLIEILSNFGIQARLTNTFIGPSVTKFEIVPDENIKVNKISGISDNIKMGLAAKDIRIEAPIPGRSAVGVEIPNAENVMVRMSELTKSEKFKDKSKQLLFTLGKDLMGEPVYCELNKMPHLLVAGATGSGKSVCMNTIIISYLLRSDPKDLKIVLIDPKKVEFTPYHDIPHLLWPVITDSDMASMMLKKAVVIMEERYDAFADAGVRDIKSFNDLVIKHNASVGDSESKMEKMPYIVIIIDELADLMMTAKKEVEASIQRLTQLSRACGIHMIVATQRPSTDVITGLIKSNIPSRISFAVSSSIDSRTILDQTGAEKLLGHGDMLYLPQGESGPIRVQGCFVTDDEIKRITDYCKKQAGPDYDDTYFEIKRNLEGESFSYSSESNNPREKDALYDEVVEYVTQAQKASTSLLQRRFGIGYNRSARIIDELEKNGIIGPSNGSKPREVYKKKDEE
ncbi:MAG: DNA translocase FtsK [Solobacterium sp.]|nr:DNA translocase FtsK [Solobacterium sp.]MDY3793741.1 DNA translocase FtsK [Erysipelotrichaceae bacterium]MCI6878590.1 DNA translocase FtsK [Solobacterium sp.]MCI7157440.1 DNA translocase FtsK [Solobacterium sp.]MDY4791056.1 DNA translocase FtsK [Erysipelotrichaceae bacterium]